MYLYCGFTYSVRRFLMLLEKLSEPRYSSLVYMYIVHVHTILIRIAIIYLAPQTLAVHV